MPNFKSAGSKALSKLLSWIKQYIADRKSGVHSALFLVLLAFLRVLIKDQSYCLTTITTFNAVSTLKGPTAGGFTALMFYLLNGEVAQWFGHRIADRQQFEPCSVHRAKGEGYL